MIELTRLSDDDIRAKVKALPPEKILFYQSSYGESSISWNEFVAQAQLETDQEKVKAIVQEIFEEIDKLAVPSVAHIGHEAMGIQHIDTEAVIVLKEWQAFKQKLGVE